MWVAECLQACADNPAAAVDMLGDTGVEKERREELVARFGERFRKMREDTSQEQEDRIVALGRDLKGELLKSGADLQHGRGAQIGALLENLGPEPSAGASLPVLSGRDAAQSSLPASVTVVNQFINNGTVNQLARAKYHRGTVNVRQTIHLGADAQEVFKLIDCFGDQDAATLKTAVGELEDPRAHPDARSAAKVKLRKFLGELAKRAGPAAIEVLRSYIDSKIGKL
jgi:hypothetical protein